MTSTQDPPKSAQSYFDRICETVGPYIAVRKKTVKSKSFRQQEAARSRRRKPLTMETIPEGMNAGPPVPAPHDVTQLHHLVPSPQNKSPTEGILSEKVLHEISLEDSIFADAPTDEERMTSPTFMTPRTSPSERKSPEGMAIDPDAHLSTDEPSSMTLRSFPSLNHYPVHTGVNHTLLCSVARRVGVPDDQVETFVTYMLPTIVPDEDDKDLHLLSFQLDLNPVFRHTQEIPFFNARPEAIRYNQETDSRTMDVLDLLRYNFVTSAITASMVYAHFKRTYRKVTHLSMPDAYIESILEPLVPYEPTKVSPFDLGILSDDNWSSLDISHLYDEAYEPSQLRTTYTVKIAPHASARLAQLLLEIPNISEVHSPSTLCLTPSLTQRYYEAYKKFVPEIDCEEVQQELDDSITAQESVLAGLFNEQFNSVQLMRGKTPSPKPEQSPPLPERSDADPALDTTVADCSRVEERKSVTPPEKGPSPPIRQTPVVHTVSSGDSDTSFPPVASAPEPQTDSAPPEAHGSPPVPDMATLRQKLGSMESVTYVKTNDPEKVLLTRNPKPSKDTVSLPDAYEVRQWEVGPRPTSQDHRTDPSLQRTLHTTEGPQRQALPIPPRSTRPGVLNPPQDSTLGPSQAPLRGVSPTVDTTTPGTSTTLPIQQNSGDSAQTAKTANGTSSLPVKCTLCGKAHYLAACPYADRPAATRRPPVHPMATSGPVTHSVKLPGGSTRYYGGPHNFPPPGSGINVTTGTQPASAFTAARTNQEQPPPSQPPSGGQSPSPIRQQPSPVLRRQVSRNMSNHPTTAGGGDGGDDGGDDGNNSYMSFSEKASDHDSTKTPNWDEYRRKPGGGDGNPYDKIETDRSQKPPMKEFPDFRFFRANIHSREGRAEDTCIYSSIGDRLAPWQAYHPEEDYICVPYRST